ncbi:MAG: STAS domain-containing protein [Olegusella sp.]|nr:STAS domain-containing protein [Olegusella sp.]
MDSTGIGVLVGAAHEASDAGVAFAVVNPQRNVARVLTLLDVADKLGVRTRD